MELLKSSLTLWVKEETWQTWTMISEIKALVVYENSELSFFTIVLKCSKSTQIHCNILLISAQLYTLQGQFVTLISR